MLAHSLGFESNVVVVERGHEGDMTPQRGRGTLVTVGSFAIILDPSQRVLLCHRRDRDLWNLPGGGVEREESPWDAVVREVAEETGLIVAVERLIGIYSLPEEDDLAFRILLRDYRRYANAHRRGRCYHLFRPWRTPGEYVPSPCRARARRITGR